MFGPEGSPVTVFEKTVPKYGWQAYFSATLVQIVSPVNPDTNAPPPVAVAPSLDLMRATKLDAGISVTSGLLGHRDWCFGILRFCRTLWTGQSLSHPYTGVLSISVGNLQERRGLEIQ